MEHPFLKNKYYTWFFMAVWALIMIAHFLLLFLYINIDPVVAVIDSFVFNSVLGVLTIGVWYPVKYNGIEKTKVLNIVFNHLIIMSVVLVFWLLVSYVICYLPANARIEYNEFFRLSMPWRILSGILIYLLVCLVYYMKYYYDIYREQAVQESELLTLVREAELNALKLQINPHFLFNSLNSVCSLTITNPEKAHDMIVKLSEYLRYSLSTSQKQLISFRDEHKNMLLYLDIEKLRFGDKLVIKNTIDPDCEEFLLPNLVLLPIIENAIKHGVYESTESVTIEILAEKVNENLQVTVTNNYDPEAPHRKGAGVGLKNVRSRLDLIYKGGGLLEVTKLENKFNVKMIFPQTETN
ncbi:MAG: hypothetical protein A2W91_01460 [Bacteroidetes bacterium GWF2_38_335]|nr:MAG: hypothetical protein A2W91_01460 [Bacteroidetes bacterium GWF2_38_335]OFY78743.1 MAG: hypothetical protein A2281_19035 [Bacteroidetes bacterium RIFOXYA12_FULL_38_20]HBS85130.1 hypothetical protein [Bacteroidales bacterium]